MTVQTAPFLVDLLSASLAHAYSDGKTSAHEAGVMFTKSPWGMPSIRDASEEAPWDWLDVSVLHSLAALRSTDKW